MKNSETADPDSVQLDTILLLRCLLLPIVYVGALFARDREMLGLVLVIWAAAYAIGWMPYLIVSMARLGRGKAPRAAAILGYGLLPWALFLTPASPWLRSWTGLALAFPAFYAWGLLMLFLVFHERPAVRGPRARLLMLAGGALIYGVVALMALTPALGSPLLWGPRAADLGWLGLLLDGLAVVVSLASASVSVLLITAVLAGRRARSAQDSAQGSAGR